MLFLHPQLPVTDINQSVGISSSQKEKDIRNNGEFPTRTGMDLTVHALVGIDTVFYDNTDQPCYTLRVPVP